MKHLKISSVLIVVLSALLLSCGTENTPTYRVNTDMTPSDGGEITVSPEGSVHDKGTEITLTAQPAEGYLFAEWTGDLSSNGSSLSFTLNEDVSVTGVFEKKTYALNLSTDGEGAIDETVVQEKTYEHGTIVEITANPATGWKFVEWTGDVTGTENPTQVTIESEKNVTAVFEKKSYPLDIIVEGEGAVAEEVVQAKSYEYGTTVELTANASTGWKFSSWNGDISGTTNPSTIVVDTAKSVTATFEKKNFALTTTVDGEGIIDKTPNQEEYEYNSNVELSASPSTGWKFVEWEGDVADTTSQTTSITIDTTKSVTAIFKRKSYSITTQVEGEGTVVKSPNQSDYLYESEVDLTAEPETGWEFIEWQGDLTGTTNPQRLIVDESKSVTAIFEPAVTMIDVTLDWNDLETVPQEYFSGSQSNRSTSSGIKEVTHFGVRVEYLASSDTLANTIRKEGNQDANISFIDIPNADSVAVYAVAIDSATNMVRKLGAIQNMRLENSTYYNLTNNDFEWFAPSWGTGPDFEESGWDTARVSKSVNTAEIEFHVVNPLDKSYKSRSNSAERLDFIIRLSGSGRIGDYIGNNIREYTYVESNPNPGVQDTITVEYPWSPYIHDSWFGFPTGYYYLDLQSKFEIIFE